MAYKLTDIVIETENHFAVKVAYGFDIYMKGVTVATRCARIGFTGEVGVEKVKAEISRREAALK